MRGQKSFQPAGEGECEQLIVTIHELAEILKVSDRQVRNYVDMGMPRRNDKRFYFPDTYRWYILRFEAAPRHQRVCYVQALTDLEELERQVDALVHNQVEPCV